MIELSLAVNTWKQTRMKSDELQSVLDGEEKSSFLKYGLNFSSNMEFH